MTNTAAPSSPSQPPPTDSEMRAAEEAVIAAAKTLQEVNDGTGPTTTQSAPGRSARAMRERSQQHPQADQHSVEQSHQPESPSNTPIGSRSNEDANWENQVLSVIHNLTKEKCPGRPSQRHYYEPGTVADYINSNPSFEGISFDQNPPETVIATAADLPPAKRMSYLLSLPLKELCSEEEPEPLRISENNYIFSDYIRAVVRWSICISLITTFSADIESIPLGYLLGHLESILASTGTLSHTGKPGGTVAAQLYHRYSVKKATEAIRRGVPIRSVLQDLSVMDQNVSLRAANEAVAARERKNKSWRNWSNYNNLTNNNYNDSSNKRPRGRPWDKSKSEGSTGNNTNDNVNKKKA
ncbi:hypothetical protein Pmar_PMAR004244 [Perkinsus marinus ATCC 50983]|uniref:Uncharacterized protein n=2 Tax=Perkinsus marinus (strain ATCC 50983 / TXsc) TaxID=423536 RepID=C5KA30_PERM5|nr:hypothetical protein Pmar_PMAR004244 [Perkinsus marinus ATCC 50983]EER18663.1 hypothetical protein Pmar_PMAR004244 [Perkinsus marinus ATCC 50983]|eukprot:XP_002786867.1 hypothetical protein Pmar_PMAR004244 [Perkinsus marinus ATCC 50983]